ncbi:putative quinol monooxygenase [Micromonospora fluostatini]|uniref:putative quinol monooxygenase n=1 Tax=Micromonospora sp. JCM 30529 TaxID=3421643 RepID=UPI003D16A6B7
MSDPGGILTGTAADDPLEGVVLIIAGTLHVDPVGREAYLAGCRQVVEQARSAPGCLDFHLSADPLDPARINVYERWAGERELLAFRAAGPDDGQAEQIHAADVRRYVISAVEAP